MRAAHRAARDDINAIFADVKAGKVDGGSQIDRSVRMEGARRRAHPIRTLLQWPAASSVNVSKPPQNMRPPSKGIFEGSINSLSCGSSMTEMWEAFNSR